MKKNLFCVISVVLGCIAGIPTSVNAVERTKLLEFTFENPGAGTITKEYVKYSGTNPGAVVTKLNGTETGRKEDTCSATFSNDGSTLDELCTVQDLTDITNNTDMTTGDEYTLNTQSVPDKGGATYTYIYTGPTQEDSTYTAPGYMEIYADNKLIDTNPDECLPKLSKDAGDTTHEIECTVQTFIAPESTTNNSNPLLTSGTKYTIGNSEIIRSDTTYVYTAHTATERGFLTITENGNSRKTDDSCDTELDSDENTWTTTCTVQPIPKDATNASGAVPGDEYTLGGTRNILSTDKMKQQLGIAENTTVVTQKDIAESVAGVLQKIADATCAEIDGTYICKDTNGTELDSGISQLAGSLKGAVRSTNM